MLVFIYKHKSIRMKILALAFTLGVLLLLPSCKKEQAALDTRTGLELLVDTSSTNYCVLSIDNGDTVVWQSSHGDIPRCGSGAGGSNGVYSLFVSNQFNPKNNQHFSDFIVYFSMKIPNLKDAYRCSRMDSLVYKGTREVGAGTDVSMSITDPFGLSMSTNYMISDKGSGTIEVLSITEIPSGGTCKKLRVKAKMKNINFAPFACKVPPYSIIEGLIQMDFQIN